MKLIKIYLAVVTALLIIGIGFGMYVWYTVQKLDTEVGGVVVDEVKNNVPEEVIKVAEPVVIPKEPVTVKTAELSDTQQNILKTFGFEGESFTVTPSMIVCAEEVLGSARLSEVLGGSSPTTIESMKLLPCFKE